MGRQSQAQAPLVSVFAAREASGDPEQKPDSWGTAGAAAGWGRGREIKEFQSKSYYNNPNGKSHISLNMESGIGNENSKLLK